MDFATIGSRMARLVFQRRGNHSEAHMSERELSELLALAASLGSQWKEAIELEVRRSDKHKTTYSIVRGGPNVP